MMVRALETSGLGPTHCGNSVRQPFMSTPGTIVRIPDAEIQAFVHGDAVARGRDTDRLDTLRVASPKEMVMWRQPASLITSNNLAVIVLTRDEAKRHQLRDVLTAKHASVR